MIAQWTKIGNEDAIIIDQVFLDILKVDGDTRFKDSKEGAKLILTPIRRSKTQKAQNKKK